MRAATEALFVKNFAGFDYIVGPSGSCVHHVRDHLTAIEQTPAGRRRCGATPASWSSSCTTCSRCATFPVGRVPAQGRPAQRLRVAARLCATAKMSEIDEPVLLEAAATCCRKVKGIEFVKPERPDECCGFGGTFSVFEEPVSAKMGYDKVDDHHQAGAEYIVSADMSCIMHQKGCARARSACRSSSSTSRRS